MESFADNLSHTAAQRIGVFTIEFPDPYAIDYENNKFDTLNESISFQYRILGNIQTLSTKGADSGSDPYGILYVPDLQSDACRSEEQNHVPANATRLADLPRGKNYALIAVAPWYNAKCTLEYMSAARNADGPTKGFFTYQLGMGNAKPPVLNDASWNLEDGGSWQTANTFPTYALSSITGDNVMTALEQYSGNISSVPNGDELSKMYDSTSYVRLWASVDTDSSNSLPSLWVFLVIVLAILIIAVSVTSLTMHLLQRRRRNDLRQRVITGEVDLEALGVKRLTVPQALLDKLPIYTYTAASESAADDPEKSAPQAPIHAPDLSTLEGEIGNKTSPLFHHSSAPAVPATGMSASWSQPTCPICLDDFENQVTQVRELPCRHVFHPDCIDTFLLRNSSLCPMCKQSVLPKGDCPIVITNMMVRRERHINNTRARSGQTVAGQSDVASQSHTVSAPTRSASAFGSLGSRLGGAFTGRRVFSSPERTATRPTDIEMAATADPSHTAGLPLPPQAAVTPSTRSVVPDCTPTQNRREWARQRALAMLGTRDAATSDGAEEENTGPRWRRTLHKVFPGFR